MNITKFIEFLTEFILYNKSEAMPLHMSKAARRDLMSQTQRSYPSEHSD
jgi:hypothetical protein